MDDHLEFLVDLCDLTAILFCLTLISVAVSFSPFWRLRRGIDTDADPFHILLIAEACFVLTVALNIYVKYFGLPTWLTFGLQVGNFLPATCEASMAVEGKNGLPCSLKRFMEWFERATRADGSGLHLDEFEGSWWMAVFYAALFILTVAVTLISWHFAAARERNGLAAKSIVDSSHHV